MPQVTETELAIVAELVSQMKNDIRANGSTPFQYPDDNGDMIVVLVDDVRADGMTIFARTAKGDGWDVEFSVTVE